MRGARLRKRAKHRPNLWSELDAGAPGKPQWIDNAGSRAATESKVKSRERNVCRARPLATFQIRAAGMSRNAIPTKRSRSGSGRRTRRAIRGRAETSCLRSRPASERRTRDVMMLGAIPGLAVDEFAVDHRGLDAEPHAVPPSTLPP